MGGRPDQAVTSAEPDLARETFFGGGGAFRWGDVVGAVPLAHRHLLGGDGRSLRRAGSLLRGVPEVIVFYVLRAVGIALFASAGVLGTVTAAGHLLGIRLLRCPLCGSWAEWILRMLGEPVDVGPILWCSRCGEVRGRCCSPVGDRDPPAERLPLGHRAAIPSGADGVCAASMALCVWQVIRNPG